MEKRGKRKLKKILGAAAIVLIVAVCVVGIMEEKTERDGVIVPGYEKVSLRGEIKSKDLTDAQYEMLLMQTGLGRPAVDKLLEETAYINELELYQQNFFNAGRYICQKIGPITREERIRDQEGNTVKAFSFADVRDGDILVTTGTHSIGWRHGHAGIVVDAGEQLTVESVVWGKPSMVQNLRKWQTYPNVMQLRIKDKVAQELGYEATELGEAAARYAMETLNEVDYGLLTGLIPEEKGSITKTQCAHLAWAAYGQFGADIDYDGGWLVTPKDIANSPELEVVQVYGVNPEAIWP